MMVSARDGLPTAAAAAAVHAAYSTAWPKPPSGALPLIPSPRQDAEIHWFSIINSLMIVLFLTGMVAMIMMRTLHRDISKYNQLESAEEAQEESGWKLVYGDVFRAPARAGLLSVLFGSGVQVLGMVIVTMFFAVLGFLSPANRGGLMTAMLLLFAFMVRKWRAPAGAPPLLLSCRVFLSEVLGAPVVERRIPP